MRFGAIRQSVDSEQNLVDVGASRVVVKINSGAAKNTLDHDEARTLLSATVAVGSKRYCDTRNGVGRAACTVCNVYAKNVCSWMTPSIPPVDLEHLRHLKSMVSSLVNITSGKFEYDMVLYVPTSALTDT